MSPTSFFCYSSPPNRSRMDLHHSRFAPLFENAKHIRWAKLPSPVQTTIKFLVGEKTFEEAETPRIYDNPRTLFFVTSLLFCGAFGIIAIYLKGSDEKESL